jgi:hypothetical protein
MCYHFDHQVFMSTYCLQKISEISPSILQGYINEVISSSLTLTKVLITYFFGKKNVVWSQTGVVERKMNQLISQKRVINIFGVLPKLCVKFHELIDYYIQLLISFFCVSSRYIGHFAIFVVCVPFKS